MVERQLRRRGIHDERVLAAMADPATVKVQLVPNPVGAGADVPALAPGDDR